MVEESEMTDMVEAIADALLDDHIQLLEANFQLRKLNETYKHWIREEGKRTDACTFNVLGEICEDCKCHRQKVCE